MSASYSGSLSTIRGQSGMVEKRADIGGGDFGPQTVSVVTVGIMEILVCAQTVGLLVNRHSVCTHSIAMHAPSSCPGRGSSFFPATPISDSINICTKKTGPQDGQNSLREGGCNDFPYEFRKKKQASKQGATTRQPIRVVWGNTSQQYSDCYKRPLGRRKKGCSNKKDPGPSPPPQ